MPHPAVGIAPPGGVSLVNIQTLLWVETPADQDLGIVTLLGQRVGLRVHVERVRWDFGDGTSDVTTMPGKKYDAADPCTTPRCPDYYGHVYSATGTMRVSAQVVWTGEFSVGGGPWQSIAGTVTGPRLATALKLEQARDVLVQDGRAPRN